MAARRAGGVPAKRGPVDQPGQVAHPDRRHHDHPTHRGRLGRARRPLRQELYLPRRDLRELISEELRRLDPDETYEETMRRLDVNRINPDDDADASQPQPIHADSAIRHQQGVEDEH